MKRIEVEVEHFFKSKFMGRKRLKPDGDLVVIGQSRDCDFHLLGDGVSPLHAIIDNQDQT